VFTQFRDHLERKATTDYLEVYLLIQRIDSGDFKGADFKLACEGLGSRFLGWGGGQPRIQVEKSILDDLKSKRSSPSAGLFTNLKRAVLLMVEDQYASFVEHERNSDESSTSGSISASSSPRKMAQSAPPPAAKPVLLKTSDSKKETKKKD